MTTKKINIYENNENKGWLGNRQNWWFDINFEQSFEIFDIDCFYEKNYFSKDHVDQSIIENYVRITLEYGSLIARKPIKNILEIGCGAGWFTEEFTSKGIGVTAIEGSKIGYEKTNMRLNAKNLNNVQLIKHDLRKNFNLFKKFDLIVCTEVSEHIEPPFSALLVSNLVSHGDIIWFSSEPPSTNDAHYHHPNEQPLKFWLNLFKFYDFSTYLLNPKLLKSIGNRGGYLIVKNSITIPEELFQTEKLIKIPENNVEVLGKGTHNNENDKNQLINKFVNDIELLQNTNIENKKLIDQYVEKINKLVSEVDTLQNINLNHQKIIKEKDDEINKLK